MNGWPNFPTKKGDISHGIFGFFAYYILKSRVSFSALTMEQTGLVLNETGLIYERRRSSSVPNVPTSTVTLRSLLSEVNALKEKVRQLEERVQTLEKSSDFNRKYRPTRLFFFQKYKNFIGSRSCSK